MIALNKLKKQVQTTFFTLVAILLFANSCPVKKAIQSQDVFTSQAANKNAQNKIITAKENCAIDTELQYASIGQTSLDWNNNLVPLALFTAIFSGLIHLLFFRRKTPSFLGERSIWTSPLRLHVRNCVFLI